MTKPYKRLNKDDVALLLVDHQIGLLSLVSDIMRWTAKIFPWAGTTNLST